MSKLRIGFQALIICISTLSIAACVSKQEGLKSSAASARKPSATDLIRSDYTPGEITALCNKAIEQTRSSYDKLAQIPAAERTTDNTLLALENISADFNDTVSPLTFMSYVSVDKAIAEEASNCETIVGQFGVESNTRRDLYQAILNAKTRNDDEARLLKKTLEAFEESGLKLSDSDLEKMRSFMKKLSDNENEFKTNLNSDKTQILLTKEELAGVPQDYIASLKVDESTGKLIVNTRESDYPRVLENAVNSETRKKMMSAYLNRAASANTKLLTDTLTVRQQVAQLMKYKTWADYRTNGRMAQNSTTVLKFLNGLKKKLAQRNLADFAKILAFKQKSEPNAKKLNQWDIAFYSNQLKKQDYSLDKEKIREYFPTEVVIDGLFKVYSKMLSVRFDEVTDAHTWAKDVKLYAIHNSSDGALIGYFYTDFYPREGKYNHAAAFSLISGRTGNDGHYNLPISSIVSNLNPPMNGKPSLLDFEDVRTVFHEFGHIMHQTLTRAPYSSLSGSSVARDFVEAPSQMLENWVLNPEILNSLSGLYTDHSKKLPPEMLQKMIEVQEFNQGVYYTKQLLYALFDMTIHTQANAVDPDKIYLKLYQEIIKQQPLPDQHFPASFGHMMGGYDAGYYGYLWSEVYAQDMFTQFPKENLTSPEVGLRYRKIILEKGNMKEALELLRQFLNREPNSDAFFKKLHI